jgi:non-homologous end joining protein Ku
MASTVWKGYISFGLVSVPVRLYAAAREQHVSFTRFTNLAAPGSSNRPFVRFVSASWNATSW